MEKSVEVVDNFLYHRLWNGLCHPKWAADRTAKPWHAVGAGRREAAPALGNTEGILPWAAQDLVTSSLEGGQGAWYDKTAV